MVNHELAFSFTRDP